MNATHVLKSFLKEQKIFDNEISSLSLQTHPRAPLLDEAYDQLAEQISKIANFEEVAEALLTEENPNKIDPHSLLKIWIALATALPQLAPALDPEICEHLLYAFQKLLDNLTLTPSEITSRLFHLKENEIFILPLTYQTTWGQSLENVVLYRKNADDTFDIELFTVEKNSRKFFGEYAFGYEKAYPLRYYAAVPSDDLLGPNFQQPVAIHADILWKTSQALNVDEHACLVAFEPLHAYLIDPQFKSRLINSAHAHKLKAMTAFIHRWIEAQSPSPLFSLELYKAFMVISRLVLVLAIRKSIFACRSENLNARLGLLSKALITSARHLLKFKDSFSLRYLYGLYEAAVGTVEKLKEESEQLLREFIPAEDRFKSCKLAVNQPFLIKKSTQQCLQYLSSMESTLHSPLDPPSAKELSINIDGHVAKGAIDRLVDIEGKIKFFESYDYEWVIPYVTSAVMNLSLPHLESEWMRLSIQECRKALPLLSFFAEILAKHAFHQQGRFLSSLQNSGVRLLAIAYVLCEKLDDQKVLNQFKPAFKGYLALTTSPYFQCESYSCWRDRLDTLSFIKGWHVQGIKPVFLFPEKGKESFDDTADGCFAEEILQAYPAIKNEINQHYYHLKRRAHLDILQAVTPRQLLLAELVNVKIQNHLPYKLDLADSWINALSKLVNIAMHVHLLSDQRSRYHVGHENIVTFHQGLGFNLTYAKNHQKRFDFYLEGREKRIRLDANQRNLFSKEKWRENQNKTLKRFVAIEEEMSNLSLTFEEAAAEPTLTIVELLSKLKYQISNFKIDRFRFFLERYLFKIVIDKEGVEKFPLLEEFKLYPQVLNTVLKDFLGCTAIFAKNLNKGILSEESKCLLNLTIRLADLSLSLGCESINYTLKTFHDQWIIGLKACLQKTKMPEQQSADIRMLLLKLIELEKKENLSLQAWKEYLDQGPQLHKQLEQERIAMDAMTRAWWYNMRYHMWRHYNELSKTQPAFIQEIQKNKNVDFLSLSSRKGQYLPIPAAILKSVDFRRLFSDRVRVWQVDKSHPYIILSDPLTGTYRLSSKESFPLSLQRLLEGQWHLYLPPPQVAKCLHLPISLCQDSIWWINCENLVARGYYQAQPDKLWLLRNDQGAVVFQEGAEKGMRLELVENEEESLSNLEKCTGAFGMHYYTYAARYIHGILFDYRDRLIFPHILMPHGRPLVFERQDTDFYEKGGLDRKLGACFYAPSVFHRENGIKLTSTSLKIYGIEIKRKNGDLLRADEETSLILPFQRHVADRHSSIVYPMVEKGGIEAPSQLLAVEGIEIKVNLYGFCPETPKENLFAAYLSLLGKDYYQAFKFLHSIRPHHRLDQQERLILKWLIDSQVDACDHSATAAAVKLIAYKILIDQGIDLKGRGDPLNNPLTSLGEVYEHYLSHLSSVPPAFRLSLEIELWIAEDKEHLKIYSCQENKALLENRKQELRTGHKIVMTEKPAEILEKSLLARWRNPVLSGGEAPMDITLELIEGIERPVEMVLLPGQPYPVKAFAYHYLKLSSLYTAPLEKWELVYTLETLKIPHFIKISLKVALQKEDRAPLLPSLNSKKYAENSLHLQSWFEQLLATLPTFQLEATLIQKQSSQGEKKEEIKRGTIFQDLDFTYKVCQIIAKYKSISPFQIIQAIKEDFDNYTIYSSLPAKESCPFKIEGNEEDFFKNDLDFYRHEWYEGIELQNNAHHYLLPDFPTILQLDKILTTYAHESNDVGMINNIVRILNRRPTEINALIFAKLKEVNEDKIQMELEDGLKTIFFPTSSQKLAFLQQRNPYFLEEDLVALQRCIQEYLEWQISNKIIATVKNHLFSIIHIQSHHPLTWKDEPAAQEAWQAIGELLNPFESYSQDNQSYLETLLFEHISGFRMRKDQAQLLHLLIEKIFTENLGEYGPAAVFQMMMGGGKTSVILAKLAKLASKNARVPLFLAHPSQYPSLKSNLMNTQFKRLHQDVIDLDFNREDLASIKILYYLKAQLQHAKDKNYLILMKANFLLILRQELIDQVKAFKEPGNCDPLTLKRAVELAHILYFIKAHCLFLVDEVDSILNSLEEINFPAGLEVTISKDSLEVIKSIYVVLSTDSKIAPLLNLLEDNQACVDRQTLQEQVFPRLVKVLISEYPSLFPLISPTSHASFKVSLQDYILEKIDTRLLKGINANDDLEFLDRLEIREKKERKQAKRHLEFLRSLEALKRQPQRSIQRALGAVALIKELCSEILPLALAKGFKQRYGFTEEGKIIPYLGVDAPNHTEFANIYVTACCYFQGAINAGVDIARLMKYRDQMREASLYYSEIYHCAPEESAEAQHFKALIGLALHQEWSSEQLQATLQEINASPQRCIDFYAEFSDQFLRYHSSLLSCGPAALSHMGAQFIGCSGTLGNKDSFPKEIADSCILEQGIEGRILVKLTQDIASQKSFLSEIDKATPHEILNAILIKRTPDAASRLRALIDASGMLKRYSNQAVAEEILNFQPLKEEIDGVVFLCKRGAQENFFLLKRELKEPIALAMTRREEFEKQGVLLERVFIYFDELRAIGSDIPFKANALVAMTFDPLSTTLRTILQGTLRARNFFHAQNVDIIFHKMAGEVLTKNVKNFPHHALYEIERLFTCALRNQSEGKKSQLLQSALQQVREIYCAAVIQKIMQELMNSTLELESLELFQAMEWLFYSSFKEDPANLFLDLKERMPAYKVVQEYFNTTHSRFKKVGFPYFEALELLQIEEKAEKIVKWAENTLTWHVLKGSSSNRETQVFVQKQKEIQLEVNVEIQKESLREVQKYAVRVDAPVAESLPWLKLKEYPESCLDYKFPHLTTFRKLLKRIPYEASYYQIFPSDLFLTENLARSHEIDLPVFHKAQKKAAHLLLIQKGTHFLPLFIDLEEAAFWRQQIKHYRLKDCWLLNLEGHLLNEESILPQECLAITKRALWWAHFFNGNACYLRAYPSLVENELKKENYELKYRFLSLKTARDLIQNQILAIDPILAQKPVEVPVFHFNNKAEETKWLNQEIDHLNQEALNQVPWHFARFFSSKQVGMLKRAGFFDYLPAEEFEHVTSEQVKLVPNYRLRHLSLPEQIAQVPAEKVYWLKGKALNYLPKEHLGRINPEELVNLSKERQRSYQILKIDLLGLEGFAKTVRPCMAPALLPECIKLIPDECLAHLTQLEQLQQVAPAKYYLLNASQFHLLPPHAWHLLKIEDYKKYLLEEKIFPEAKAFIQAMNPAWVNEVDPRLASYFSNEQVLQINQPCPLPYLNIDQLELLDASLASYLDLSQIAKLSISHRHLIQTLIDGEQICHLSKEGLAELSVEQVKKIFCRQTLLRLDKKFYPYLLAKQIALLQPEYTLDQEIINALDGGQVQRVAPQHLLLFLPYLNLEALRSVSPLVIGEAQGMAVETFKKLTSLQIQSFLSMKTLRPKDLLKALKNLLPSQWGKMEEVFIETFFSNQPREVIKNVPKQKVRFLSRKALLMWYDADKKINKQRDTVIGVMALLFYPLVILSAVMFVLFATPKRSVARQSFCQMALSPLRILSPERYYRFISSSK
ncbi:hypothetical protein NEOC84_001652|uniref:DUF3638 domain-containing protein n=1 Tax=Neochlamydia sp. AcF84 TaxID=2315858 RepID=UPI00140B2A5D|nr:DUF3638 domain-containing protein [Neochlamydia sp. AcF84]NGY95727.1 hypothetical protein [Neochlamydia sp. AcF84]